MKPPRRTLELSQPLKSGSVRKEDYRMLPTSLELRMEKRKRRKILEDSGIGSLRKKLRRIKRRRIWRRQLSVVRDRNEREKP